MTPDRIASLNDFAREVRALELHQTRMVLSRPRPRWWRRPLDDHTIEQSRAAQRDLQNVLDAAALDGFSELDVRRRVLTLTTENGTPQEIDQASCSYLAKTTGPTGAIRLASAA